MAESPKPPATHKPGSGPLLPPRDMAYSYRWGRIFTGMIVILLTALLISYGYRHWGGEPSETVPKLADAPVQPQAEANQMPVAVNPEPLVSDIPEPFSPDEMEEPEAIGPETMPPGTATLDEVKPLLAEAIVREAPPTDASEEQISDDQASVSAPVEEEQIASEEPEAEEEVPDEPVYFLDEEIPPEADASTEAQPVPEPAKQEVVEPQVVEETAEFEPIAEPEVEEPKAEPQAEEGHFVLQDEKINATGVKRFQLARTVKNREPVGDLSDIDFNAKGSTSVWAFSDVRDMRGERLNYVWLYEGSEVARVRNKVGADRWRSYSSKTVLRNMTGAWRVELQDNQGRQLASADFNLR